jgi:hypothetical protein
LAPEPVGPDKNKIKIFNSTLKNCVNEKTTSREKTKVHGATQDGVIQQKQLVL